ncbi:MAG: hypothetical protein JWN72_790 [Thermoleophilia bacterium]|nr:hypothetical protein [Thermoleophilia bacterium]
MRSRLHVRHGRTRTRVRFACATVVALLLALGIGLATAPPSESAGASVVVTASIVSATSLDTTGCATGAAGRTSFGNIQPGSSNVTSVDCDVAFGSTNNAAQLQVAQGDGAGAAMWMSTTGALDATFDGPSGTGNGKVIIPVTAFDGWGYAAAVQPDGSTLVAGVCGTASPYPNVFCVMRLLPSGALDPAFDGPTGTGNGAFTFAQGSQGSDWLKRIIVQPDGKILLSGECLTGVSHYMCITRLNSDGSYDTAFDGPSGTGNGRVGVDLGNEAWSYGLALQPDGMIVLGGKCYNGSNNDFCVARLNGTTGAYDTTFDGPSGTGNGMFAFSIGASHDDGAVVTLQPDGKVVIGGACYLASGYADPCFARLNVNGSFDTAFDGPSGTGNGRFIITGTPYDDILYDGLVAPDGSLLYNGFCDQTTHDSCFVRLLPTGALDPTFDGPTGTGNGLVALTDNTAEEEVDTIRLQPDGRVIGVGTCGSTATACVTRINADGTLDTRFKGPGGANAGVASYPIGTADSGSVGADFASDGRLVLAGGCANGSAIYRVCIQRLDTGASISNYSNLGGGGDTDWASATATTNTFAACVRGVAGGASATWPSTGACTSTDSTSWNAVPTTAATIAATAAPVPDPPTAIASLRFGLRTATNQPPGSYVAPIVFSVIAP